MADTKTQGTQLKIGDGASPEVFTKIPGISSVGGMGGGEAQDIDTTDFDSVAMEFLQGLPDEGTLTFSGNYDPASAQQTLLDTKRAAQESANFQVVDVNNTTFSFTAFVKSFEKVADANDAWRLNLSLRVTGAITKT